MSRVNAKSRKVSKPRDIGLDSKAMGWFQHNISWFSRLLDNLRVTLQWCRNEGAGVSIHQPHDCLLNRLFKAQMKENFKAPRHRPLWGESTGDRWIPRTKASNKENVFYLMTSSWRRKRLSSYRKNCALSWYQRTLYSNGWLSPTYDIQ